MDINISETADISVEVEALNLDGIKQSLLDYLEKNAKIDIDDSVEKADKSAQDASDSATEAAASAESASDSANQASESLGLYYTKSEADTLLNNKQNTLNFDSLPTSGSTNPVTSGGVYTALADHANTSLNNLSATGQMIIDSQNGTISNCILDIPQNIILELSGNTLTAKSGSVLTDSGSTYQTITLTTDKTLEISNAANLKRVVFATSSGTLSQATFDVCVSGTTDSLAGVPYHIWFDTNNKEVNYYGSDGTTASHRTYPLCVVETDANGVASFAKNSNGNYMIFNGAGFIGNHGFIYPGIKMLNPMGLNNNGKLMSELTVTNSLTIVALGSRNSICCYNSTTLAARNYLGEYKTIEEAPTNISSGIPVVYISGENKSYQFSDNTWRTNNTQQRATVLLNYTVSGTTVTNFSIRQPIKTATVEMLNSALGNVETLLATI